MKRKLFVSAVAVSALWLTGCGGGGSSSTPTVADVTGQFIDAAVDGLDYSCEASGKSGVTSGGGNFTCKEGDTVTFSLGGYVLGSTSASSGVVTPYTLYAENETAAIDIAQLLQTIDSDKDPSNGITIPDAAKEELSGVTVPPGADNFDTEMEKALGESLVPEAEARAHLDETIQSVTDLTEMLAGKTLYTTIEDDTGTMESWTFSSDMKQLTWKEIKGGDDQGTVTITSVNGMEIKVQDDEGEVTINVLRILPDYLEIKITETDGVEFLRLYFSKEKAEAYDPNGSPLPIPALTELFGGKTLYTTIEAEAGTLESWGFNADVSSVTWSELAGGDDSGSGSLSIDGTTMTYTEGSEQTEIKVVALYTDYVVVTIDGQEQKLYFAKDKAMRYLLLANQMLYTAIEGSMGTLESWEFNADASSVTWTEMVGGDETGSGTLSFKGMTMIYTEGGETTSIVVNHINLEYMDITIGGSEATRLYYNETDARAYFLK